MTPRAKVMWNAVFSAGSLTVSGAAAVDRAWVMAAIWAVCSATWFASLWFAVRLVELHAKMQGYEELDQKLDAMFKARKP